MAAIASELVAIIATARAALEAETRHYHDVYEPLERAWSSAIPGDAAPKIDPDVVEENNALCRANCEAEYAVAGFAVTSTADFEAKIAFMVEREMFRGIDQGECIQEDARRLAGLPTASPIQMLAQLRSDLSARQDVIHSDGGDMENSRRLSHDLSRLLHVMLSQQPQSLVDVFSLVAAVSELASQELCPDPEKPDVEAISEAGLLVEMAGTSIVAFLVANNVEPQNAYDRSDARRCSKLSADRFPQTTETEA